MNDILSQIIAYAPNKIDTETKARALAIGPRAMVGEITNEQTQFGRPIYKTPSGEKVSEKSVTLFFNGDWMNVPSIHGGKSFNEDELRRMIKQGNIEPTSVHKSKDDAEAAAKDRSDSMVQGPRNMAQGGRIGFEKGGPLTGEKFKEIVTKYPEKTNQELLDYFKKNKFTNRLGDPLTTGAIKTQKSKFFDIAAETKSQTPKGYISSTEVFENLPISKKDYFRVKQAKEGGTLLTKEIDKLLKPVKIGDTFYFKKPSKNDSRSFSRLADKTGRLNNRIADLMIDFDKAYGKSFAKGIIPTLEDVTNKFNITDSTAGKVTTRLAQWYGGQDFKNPQLKDLKRNKVSSNRMFKTIEKSAFGNPYRDGLYQISMQTIDSKLGNKQGTFEKFKSQAKQILKDNNIPIYDPKMGKNAFGFNINEIAGVTGSAKSKAAEFSQFVDVMEGNINTKAMAGFQSKLSTARAAIEKDPTKLSVESKKINKMAKNLEKTYGVELPRLQDPDATKYFSPKRLNELKTQGLDIVKAAERAGYTIQMPKGAMTVKEFTELKPIQVKGIAKKLDAAGFKCQLSNGLTCNDPRAYTKSIKENMAKIQQGDDAAIAKLNKLGKGMNAFKGAAKFTGWGLLAELGIAAPLAAVDYAKGANKDEIISNATYGLFGKSEDEQLREKYSDYGQAKDFQKTYDKLLKQESALDDQTGYGPIINPQNVKNTEKKLMEQSKQFDSVLPPSQGLRSEFDLGKFLNMVVTDQQRDKLFADQKAQRAEEIGILKPSTGLESYDNFMQGGIASLNVKK